jgi:phage shock protein A
VSTVKQRMDTHARSAGNVAKRLENQLETLNKSRDAAQEEVENLRKRLMELVETRCSKVLADMEAVYK